MASTGWAVGLTVSEMASISECTGRGGVARVPTPERFASHTTTCQ